MVTILVGVILVFLVISELVSYVSVDTVDVLTVDKRRGEKLPINLDIFFPSLTCNDVAVDVVEASSGETLEDAAHQIIKQRIDVDGKPLLEGIQKGINNNTTYTAINLFLYSNQIKNEVIFISFCFFSFFYFTFFFLYILIFSFCFISFI